MESKELTLQAAKWFTEKTYLEQHNLSDKYFESRNPSLLNLFQVEAMYVSEMQEELKKCQESPYYFFTNYFLVDGKKPTVRMTEEEFNSFAKRIKQSYGQTN
jgi:hypothetical protein